LLYYLWLYSSRSRLCPAFSLISCKTGIKVQDKGKLEEGKLIRQKERTRARTHTKWTTKSQTGKADAAGKGVASGIGQGGAGRVVAVVATGYRQHDYR
jgi:hypothetical protein